jgi:hypothetical protein
MEVPIGCEDVHLVVVDAELHLLKPAEIHKREIGPSVRLLDRNDVQGCGRINTLVPKAVICQFGVCVLDYVNLRVECVSRSRLTGAANMVEFGKTQPLPPTCVTRGFNHGV